MSDEWIFLSKTTPEIGKICKIKTFLWTAIGTWNGKEFVDVHSYKGAIIDAPIVKWRTI